MSQHHPLKVLECFGVGLGAVACLLLLVIAIGLFRWWTERFEIRVALWFAAHPRLLKACKITGVAILVICLVVIVTAAGCFILEGM